MMSPLITILVPIYNCEDYLRQCLDSACGQTYRHIEIICINDGSTDGSAEIIAEYAARDNRIVVITQENQGLSGARNSGLAVASGDWICGLDSDDYLEPDAIEKLVPKLDDDIDCLCFDRNVLWENPEDEKRLYRVPFEGKYAMTPELLPKINVTFCCKLWRKSFIERTGVRFLLGMWYEDNHFSLCTLPWARYVYFSPLRLLNIRRNGTSSIMKETRSKASHKVLDYLGIYEEIFKHYRQSNFRQWCNVSGASDMEMNMALRTFNFINANGPLSTLEEGWKKSCQLIDTYGLKERLPEFPKLAIYYHIPPYVVSALNNIIKNNIVPELKKIANNTETAIGKQIELLQQDIELNKNEIKKQKRDVGLSFGTLDKKRASMEAKLHTTQRMNELNLLIPKLKKQYRLLKLKKLFSWGKRKKTIKDEAKKIKQLIREWRYGISRMYNDIL